MRLRPIFVAAAACVVAVFARADGGEARFDAAGCRTCHRIGPRGGDSGPDLTLVGFRRPRAWIDVWLSSPRAWKRDALMPEQGLSAADRGALVDYLSAQKGGAWEGTKPWDGFPNHEKGRILYSRAGCVACHGAAGRGGHPNPGAHGDVIPALTPLLGTYTSDELKAKIRNGVNPEGHDGHVPAVTMPAWTGVLGEDELNALSSYLLSLAERRPPSDW